MTDATALLAGRIDRALAARQRLRDRPVRDIAAALAAAADYWRRDGLLLVELATRAGLSRPMVAEVLPIAAAALNAEAMTELAGREVGGDSPEGPALIVQVLASNIPAMALQAAAASCLVRAAVVLKSGRGDPLSAPAFQRALATIDPDLAATVVPVYWAGGCQEAETAVFQRADLVVATGSDPTLTAIAPQVPRRFLGYGTRHSVVAVGGDVRRHAAAVAQDVALYDQRGCLSAQAVYVEGDAPAFAEALAEALGRIAERLPPGWSSLGERAGAATVRASADWDGATVITSTAGTVLLHDRPGFEPTSGHRTVRVYPITDAATLPALLPPGQIECVGVADIAVDTEALRTRGVARVCPVGRMQRPPISWPRGQRSPLRALLDPNVDPVCAVEG